MIFIVDIGKKLGFLKSLFSNKEEEGHYLVFYRKDDINLIKNLDKKTINYYSNLKLLGDLETINKELNIITIKTNNNLEKYSISDLNRKETNIDRISWELSENYPEICILTLTPFIISSVNKNILKVRQCLFSKYCSCKFNRFPMFATIGDYKEENTIIKFPNFSKKVNILTGEIEYDSEFTLDKDVIDFIEGRSELNGELKSLENKYIEKINNNSKEINDLLEFIKNF